MRIVAYILISAFFASISYADLPKITSPIETDFGLYIPVNVPDFTPDVPAYSPASDLSDVSIHSNILLTQIEKDILKDQCFLARPCSYIQLYDIYNENREKNIPSFATTDLVLHTYHILYDYLLREIETEHLGNFLELINIHLLEEIKRKYEGARSLEALESTKRTYAYVAVANTLLNPNITLDLPDEIQRLVDEELHLIKNGEIEFSAIFDYREDYSQYRPRGHYTRSELLQNYFRSMMWYGRMFFRLKVIDEITNEEDVPTQSFRNGKCIISGSITHER